MGHANSKQRAEVERIIAEVKDIDSFIRRNSQEFDDQSRDNLHKRLIAYSNLLQDLAKSTRERHSKELKEAIKFVSKITEELLLGNTLPQNLDQGSVETNSFIHVPSKKSKSGSVESLTKKQNKSKKDIINLDKYRLPSLEEIQAKAASLKSEVDNSILNEDVNQMLLQQKIIQILATDLEMITYESYSPLQTEKSALEKELSVLYRKLEKNKNKIQRRNSEIAHTKQQTEARQSLVELANLNDKADQIMCQAHTLIKEKKIDEVRVLNDDLEEYKKKINAISVSNAEIQKQKLEVEQKINKIFEYVKNEVTNYEDIEKKKLEEDITKIEMLVEKYKTDIMRFDQYTDESMYPIYKKNLGDVENILGEIMCSDNDSQKRKTKCLENVKQCQKMNQERLLKFHHGKQATKDQNTRANDENIENEAHDRVNKIESEISGNQNQAEDDVVLRNKVKPLQARSIDGFYSYWKEIQSNLPAVNCSLEELRQIALLLFDIEDQIRSKRTKIENFLKLKKGGTQFNHINNLNYEDYSNKSQFDINKQIIDEIDQGAVKTNVKVYTLTEPKVLVIDDEEIIQNIDEINKQMKTITKEAAEKVILPPDSASESSQTSREEHNERKLKQSDKIPEKLNCEPTKGNQASIDDNTYNKVLKRSKDANNKSHIESITQIQNISRDVEYLKEKAMSFTGTKQTPKYVDIKTKLDSFRRTLNVLISYQNENITSSCNRVIGSIDEVIEILNINTEKQRIEPLNNSAKRNTIETVFVDIMDIKTANDDLSKRIENFHATEENEEFVRIKNSLLQNKTTLNDFKVTSNYEIIANSRAEVLKQIDESLYNLDFKLEENRIKNRISKYNEDSTTRKIMTDFQKIKDKINRFSGSYKNVLYREIEKSTEKYLFNARGMTDDKQFLESLEENATKYLKILEEKSTREEDYATKTREFIQRELDCSNDNLIADNAIRLSRIRQNLKDIKEEVYSPTKKPLELNQQLDHRINLNILELSSINILTNEPFYYDKETLKAEFLELSAIVKQNIAAIQGEPTTNNKAHSSSVINEKQDDLESELFKIEHIVESVRTDIGFFSGERNSNKFFDIDEQLTRLSMTTEKIQAKKSTDHYKKKRILLKSIYDLCEILENKAQTFEILQNIEKRITEVRYRVNNFDSLSDGDYNALYRELVDLNVTLKDLNVGEDLLDKKLACQNDIQQCLGLIEDMISRRDNYEHGSDDGTLV